jgi:hypothetical protein
MQVYQQQIVHHIARSFVVVVVWACIVVSCTHVAVVDRDAQVHHLRQVIQLHHVVNTILVQQHHSDVFHHNIAWDLILDLY